MYKSFFCLFLLSGIVLCGCRKETPVPKPEPPQEPIPATPLTPAQDVEQEPFDFNLQRVQIKPWTHKRSSLYRDHFVDEYVQSDIYLSAPHYFYPLYRAKPFCLHMQNAPRGNLSTWLEYDDDKDTPDFQAAAKANNDLTFKQLSPVWVTCWRDNFASLHVYSDKAWDEAHPAGTPLDDLIQLIYFSAAPFVDGGYRLLPAADGKERDYLQGLRDGLFRTAHTGRLSEIGRDMRMVLIYEGVWLYFSTTPPAGEEHEITVKWTTTEGVVKSASESYFPGGLQPE